MATHDLSKMNVRELCERFAIQMYTGGDVDIHVAELSRRMTPPPGCVRIGDKDVKVLGTLSMTEDGLIIANHFTDVWAIHERTGKPYKTSLYHRGFLSKLYSTEEAAKQAAEAARSSK
jgi:hypothetical protein